MTPGLGQESPFILRLQNIVRGEGIISVNWSIPFMEHTSYISTNTSQKKENQLETTFKFSAYQVL